jgi:hypothetical protein
MATTVNKYLDNADFLLATAVFDDAALTTPAADGFYQQNGIYREQSGGALIAGSTTCPSCSGNSQELRLNGVSAQNLCCTSSTLYTAHFATGDSFTNPATTLMYADSGLLNLAPDGWYKLKNSTQYRQQNLGVLGALTACPTCPSGGFFMSQGRSVCTDFCATSPSYVCTSQQYVVSGNDYFTLTIGDVIAGAFTFVDGYYAYADTSGVSTPNGVFRIMELFNNEVVDILECDNVPGGPCVNL